MPRSRFAHSISVVCAAVLIAACGGANRVAGQAGDEAMAKKAYGQAVNEYRLDVRANPQSGELRRKLAIAYESNGNLRAAATEYVRVADLLPNDMKAQLDAATRLLFTNQFEDARTRAENVLKTDPKNLQAHMVRGNALARLGEAEDGVAGLREALKNIPSTTTSLNALGGLELRTGQAQQAEAAFKQAVVVGETDPNTHIALARYYQAVGRYAEAEPPLKRALELDPKNINANRALARLYLSTGRVAAAEAPLKEVVAHAGTADAQVQLADYYVAQNRDNDALAILKQVASSSEGQVAAQTRIAGIDYKQGRVAQAHKSLADLLAKDPENAQLLVVQGGWFAQEDKTDDAFRAADAAVRADNESAPAHALLGAMQVRKGNIAEAIGEYQQVIRIAPRDLGANIELARLHLRNGQPAQAIDFAEEALRDAPLNGTARALLASALLNDGQLSRAQAEAQMVVKGAPSRPEGHILMGEVHYRRSQPALARKAFEEALRLDPSSVGASTGLARIEVGSKQTPAAVARIDAQLTNNPKDPKLALLAGRAHASAGDYGKAETLFKQAIALDPNYGEAYNTLGQLYVQQGKMDQAQAEYQALAAKQPSNIQVHTMVAMLLHAKGKTAEARAQYEKIVALDRRATVAANNLAYMYAEEDGNLDVALNLAQSAKAASPDDPDVDDTLGWIYYKKELPALAIEPLRRSVGKDPKNALYHVHLGLAYLKSGDARNARDSLKRARDLAPDVVRQELGKLKTADAKEAQSALDSVRG